MTRARYTLTLMNTGSGNPFLAHLRGHESGLSGSRRVALTDLNRNWRRSAGD